MSLDIKFGVREIPEIDQIEKMKFARAECFTGKTPMFTRLLTGLKRRRLLRCAEG